MKTPTLVLAVILAMAVVGDSANLEKILSQLRMLAGEKTIDDVPVTHINTVKAEGEGTDRKSKETKLLDLLKKFDLASSKAVPEAKKEGGEEGADVEQIYDAGESNSYFEEEGGKGHADQEQTYDVTEIGGDDSSLEDGKEDASNVEQNYDMAGIGGHDSAFSATKEGGEEGAGAEQIYDQTENKFDFEDTNPVRPLGDVNQAKAYDSQESVATLTDSPVKDARTALKNMQGDGIGGSSTDGSKETKKAVPAFLVAAAKEIGGKVVDALGDRIAEGVVENHQEKVVSALQDYLGKQMDKFDDEYNDLLKDTSDMAAGLDRQVEEADIQLVPRPGATMGNMYAPPGWEIRHKYKYKDDGHEERDGGHAAYTYPSGLGPVMMNGCFGTGYGEGDPCREAKIPLQGCPNMIDGATYLGVGFDGRGVYSAESRKKSVIQRSCENLQTYGKHQVPDSMTPEGIYDTNVESYTFSSMEGYRHYLAEKSAVTSGNAMFQEEINKASGYGAVGGAFGIGWSAGGGQSSQSGSSSQSSGFSASSSASAQLSEKQTQTFMAMLEINIFRYELFMDDVTPDRLNVGFLRDFISLPESYFSAGAEMTFQNFYLRWGTHYIKSAKFGGQLKIIKTKQATAELSISEFATKAEEDWKMTMSTFSAQAEQTKSSSWWHEHETKDESQQSDVQAESGTETQENNKQDKQASSQEYSNEELQVQGGDQQIAAAITEMYTTSLTTELKDWLESIDDYPKPFSFVLRPVSDLLNIPFASLFPAGDVDYGCFGERNLTIEEETGRKYYIQQTTKQVIGNEESNTGNETVTVSEIRYCNFKDRQDLEDSMTKRRLSLERAVTVYLEEGRLLSSDFLLPAGVAGCETAMLAFLQGDNTGVPTWEDMIGGNEFTVVFDMPYGIPGILQAQDVLELKFYHEKWFSNRRGSVPHLYDGYSTGDSDKVNKELKKVSVQGLVMTYNEETGVFTVTDEDFNKSAEVIPDLLDWIEGRDVARAEYKNLIDHLSDGSIGDVPCAIQWSNAHRFYPTEEGKCIHFTAASEGDIFVVFASIPKNHETWIYIQISPDGVSLYKALRLQTTLFDYNAGGLGSAILYQSYFVCVTEHYENNTYTTVIQYGKTPGNEEKAIVLLSFEFDMSASLRYYSFGSGESPVKVMGLSLMDTPAIDFVCQYGTVKIGGKCQQDCHSQCEGCHRSGTNSPTDCITCKHLKVAYPYKEGQTGDFECVAQCPQHMQPVAASKTCQCIKRMEENLPGGVWDCKTECPLTHFDDNNTCRKCSSFCVDVSVEGKRVCLGPSPEECTECKYKDKEGCLEGCSPGQKAHPGNGSFMCLQCEAGYECKLGDETEDICPEGTASNDDRTKCEPCAAGEFSNTPGAASCQKCPAGKYSTGGGSPSCSECPAGSYSDAAGSTRCEFCPSGTYSSTDASSSCTDCPVGQYSAAESTRCTDCPAGQYNNAEGADSCNLCPAGKYSTAGSSSCESCPAGQYSSSTGSTYCKSCPAGTYSSMTDSVECTACPAGSFSSRTESMNCESCPAGKYSSNTASTYCESCSVGTYSSSAKSTYCERCPDGSTTDQSGQSKCIEKCGLSTFVHYSYSDCSQNNDLDKQPRGGSVEDCADACCANSKCLSFQYNVDEYCFLKSKLCSVKAYASGGNMYDRMYLPEH